MKRLSKAAWLANAAVVGMWSANQAHAAGTEVTIAVQPTLSLSAGVLAQDIGQSGTGAVVGPTYSIKFKDTDVTQILKVLGDISHTHIIVSDDVNARLPYLDVVDAPVATILQRIAGLAHLAVGKIGIDTYLIVNAPSIIAQMPFNPLAPYLPRVEPVPLPGSQAEADPHHDWQPHTFNGMTYYMIPLTQSPTTPAPKAPTLMPALPPTIPNSGAITPAK